MTPKYFNIEELINFIDEPNRIACLKIYYENRKLFETTPGSTHNHQAWKSGYIEHVAEVMNYAYYLYDFDITFGRPLPFTKSDALLIMFLHDLEKPWRIEVNIDGLFKIELDLRLKKHLKNSEKINFTIMELY